MELFCSLIKFLRFPFQLYFFTVEFGLCRQKDGTLKVYGAGLLSSVAELQHALSTSDKIKRFDPEITCKEECIITSYQNAYYFTDSLEEAKDRMRYVPRSIAISLCLLKISFCIISFSGSLPRTFNVRSASNIIRTRKPLTCCQMQNG